MQPSVRRIGSSDQNLTILHQVKNTTNAKINEEHVGR